MSRRILVATLTAVACALGWEASGAVLEAQSLAPQATFRSSVDLVRVSAIVRDRKGRFVQNLEATDFEVLEGGQPRAITDFRHDLGGVSVALLFDISGSMEAMLAPARQAATHILSWLEAQDEAAVFTFDTRLSEVGPFTMGLKQLPDALVTTVPFGATSLHDAIAATAQRVGGREGRRRAVVVFTDGNDNASRLAPEEVSAVASGIDVPVYIFGVVLPIDNPSSDNAAISSERSPFTGALDDLAQWTGGRVFVTSTPADFSSAARQIVDELRHQYLIAFESSGQPGWHPLAVHARAKDLVVHARAGYIAGQSRPTSP